MGGQGEDELIMPMAMRFHFHPRHVATRHSQIRHQSKPIERNHLFSGGTAGLVAAPSSLSGKKALFCLVGLALGLASGLGLVYLYGWRRSF